jgi:hypothetical protein
MISINKSIFASYKVIRTNKKQNIDFSYPQGLIITKDTYPKKILKVI